MFNASALPLDICIVLAAVIVSQSRETVIFYDICRKDILGLHVEHSLKRACTCIHVCDDQCDTIIVVAIYGYDNQLEIRDFPSCSLAL